MVRKKRNAHSKRMDLWNILVGIGSICGIAAVLALPYTIVQIRRGMPAIRYEVTGGVSPSVVQNGQTFIEKNINGKLKNLSSAPNSIASISLVVFNDSRSAYLRDGYGADHIYEFTSPGDGQEISLPISLNPKETKKLNIVSSFPLGETDAELFSQSYPRLTEDGFVSATYEYELIFEDVHGNNFDANGILINKELMDLRWIHQDAKWYDFKAFTSKTWAIVKFNAKRIMGFFGLSTQ